MKAGSQARNWWLSSEIIFTKQRAEPKHGKMKVKELVGQGQGASSIEVTDSNIKTFEKVAKKYNVDFAVKKDKTVDPPKYMVFFKGKDTDVISQAFKEFVKVNEKKKAKRLDEKKELVASEPERPALDKDKSKKKTEELS